MSGTPNMLLPLGYSFRLKVSMELLSKIIITLCFFLFCMNLTAQEPDPSITSPDVIVTQALEEEEYLQEEIYEQDQGVAIFGGIYIPRIATAHSSFQSQTNLSQHIGLRSYNGYNWKIVTGVDYYRLRLNFSGIVRDTMAGTDITVEDELKAHILNVPIYLAYDYFNDDYGLRPYIGLDVSFMFSLSENDFNYTSEDLDGIQVWLSGGLEMVLDHIIFKGNYGISLNRFFAEENEPFKLLHISAGIGYRF